MIWEVKSAPVHLVEHDDEGDRGDRGVSVPTDRVYWLIVARQPRSGETKYFIANAAAGVSLLEMLQAALARWHIEKWFERAKQQTGFGAFEVRSYQSLIRHWLCSRLAMFFLAAQTCRLREKKSADHARTVGPGCQHPGVETLATQLSVMA